MNFPQVSIPVISRTTCNRIPNVAGEIEDNMMCAAIDEGGKDSCQVGMHEIRAVRGPLNLIIIANFTTTPLHWTLELFNCFLYAFNRSRVTLVDLF